ncbi:MAG: signal peptidase I [Nitrospirae bacterium]|nr:signal peptidase I [Nitrospirota bacterium]
MAKKSGKSKFREYVEAISIAIILALFIRAFVIQAFKIPSGSMIPTLLIGDHILVNKFTYGIKIPFADTKFLIFNSPKKGDIIVFPFPKNKEKAECTSLTKNITSRLGNAWQSKNLSYLFQDDCRDFIKRVGAVGGDKLEITNKKLYINGVLQNEPYTVHYDQNIENALRDNFGPFIVPRNSVFAMGDNRDQSYDSRFWGVVPVEEIKGKAFIMYWSWDNEGGALNKIRWGRIGRLIH